MYACSFSETVFFFLCLFLLRISCHFCSCVKSSRIVIVVSIENKQNLLCIDQIESCTNNKQKTVCSLFLICTMTTFNFKSFGKKQLTHLGYYKIQCALDLWLTHFGFGKTFYKVIMVS